MKRKVRRVVKIVVSKVGRRVVCKVVRRTLRIVNMC